MSKTLRIAVFGIILESNRFAPVATQAEFASLYILEGDDILRDARSEEPVQATETTAFIRTMDATGPWEPVPLILAGCHPFGPADQGFIDEVCDTIIGGLKRAGPLDGVFITNHGAMVSTEDDDPDGTLVRRVREVVGPDCPVLVCLDLHANVGDDLSANADMVVGYLTNPHVDMTERGEESALAMRLVLAGRAAPKLAHIRLPLTPPSVTLLTAEGPYADIIQLGQRRKRELGGRILNVSIFGNFVFSDTPMNGVSILVTARHDLDEARALARELAETCWADRQRFQRTLTTIDDAVGLATTTARAPLIYSEAGDNPGGGGSGRTTALLAALHSGGAQDVFYGSFFDPSLAAEAHAMGVDGRFEARFNREPGGVDDRPFSADATVIALHDGHVTGRLGLFAGRRMHLGPSAALKIGGMTVIIISDRTQTADPMFFEMFGLDIADARTVVVKSRGHFRAGFSPWFKSAQVVEVDTPGLTSPVLSRFDWKGLPRPVYPLDPDTMWTPPDW
ncbi:MAG: M81 family metallopeptidase [Pseudomonadota bacterium]